MNTQRSHDTKVLAGQCKKPFKNDTTKAYQNSRILPERKKTTGFMDPQDALQAHTMIRTAIDAMSCDQEILRKAVEKDREPSGPQTKRRPDFRLVVLIVGLLFIILAIDLLFQIL